MCQHYHTNKMAESPDRSTGSKSEKIKGSFSYKTKYNASWFSQQNLKQYKDVITQSKLGESHFHCKICNKDVLCSHGGASDLVRHCTAATHQKLEKERRTQPPIGSFAYTKTLLRIFLREKQKSSQQDFWLNTIFLSQQLTISVH